MISNHSATVVVTIMGAVSAELQSLGRQPNFFYLQHAMGLASSLELGITLSWPQLKAVVFDGDGSILMGSDANVVVVE
jgi:sulfopyruvate decarboxylase subunit beta